MRDTAAQQADVDVVPELIRSNREVMLQALELQRLGNDYNTIASLLLQTGATLKQVKGAIRTLKQRIAEKKRKQTFLIASFGLLAVVVVGAIVLAMLRNS